MPLDLPENVQIGPDHIWCQVFESAQRFQGARPALFLDRDGVIVEEVHYLHKVEDVVLIDGAAQVIAKANKLDIPVIVVTNQSGLARGMFGWQEFNAVQERMHELLAEATGAYVDAVYACPFHENAQVAQFKATDHEARKPNPGMLVRAMKAIAVNKNKSWIVGDKASDLKAGLNAGVCGAIHVLSGHGSDAGEREKAKAVSTSDFDVHLAKSICGIDRITF